MTQATEWLNGYITAWTTKDPDDVRAVFSDDAEYWFRPDDDDPEIGIDAILAMWKEPEPTEAVHDLRVLIENDALAIITGTVDYPGHQSYSNMWEVWFAPDGRAVRFVEWFMTPDDDED
ncbi:nuclear transport factor 2 family protein [Microbacterium sp. W1N]|uniref:nuclear transport factor 2 family protein n=1 Tax=Microbacterium festucae TaxID=2977531 RepID=UPI0021C01016|nr:nuclear transport factor 2 family protein [Microbacterium festucae]MCT9819940.1 nuclear transport factor 2 family protein [Microbacterium festucae]